MTYIILFKLSKAERIKVGSLGERIFPSGFYAYVGSAKKNLQARLKRHLSKRKRIFWHIDYILSKRTANVWKIFIFEKDAEHSLANSLSKNFTVIEKFGSSDCKCIGHLFMIDDVENFERKMEAGSPTSWNQSNSLSSHN